MTKKIATIYYAGFARFGGVISHVRAIDTELTRLGWTVNIISLDKLPIWCRFLPHLVEKVINFFNKPMGFLYKDRLTRILYKYFFNDKVNLRIFEDIYITWNSNIPSITILHAVWSDNLQSYKVDNIQENNLKTNELKILESINHPIATVSFPYLKYIKDYHFNVILNKNINVIELGINQSQFSNKRDFNRKSIIYVGTLETRKNIHFLLNIYKKLLEFDNSFRLTIVGDGPQRRQLEFFSLTNNLNVSFLGAQKHDLVISELHKHGIYLHTSTKESFSYSLLEAKLAGLKTCAYANLQVPKEFVDVPIDSMEVDDWCKGIQNIDWSTIPFDGSKYSVERMTARTLELST
jgi:glycosyltransferase involved in cell wall biosynthesis